MPVDLQQFASPQTRFLAACSYLAQSEAGRNHQGALLEDARAFPLQPEALLRGTRHHRIFALAEQVVRTYGLQSEFAHLQPGLLQGAKQSRLQSLRLLTEANLLSETLEARNISYQFVKGPHLSRHIYGDASLRHSKDLDLLVRPEDVHRTLSILAEHGWQPLRGGGQWAQGGIYRWLAERRLRHFELVHTQKQLVIELHWRLEYAHAPEFERIWSTHWTGSDSGSNAAQFLFLCLHGATHGWLRLKWIGDIQALLERHPDLLTRCLPLMEQLKLGPVVAQTMLLLRVLYGVEPAGAYQQVIQYEAQAWPLARFALNRIHLENASLQNSPRATCQHWNYRWHLHRRLGCFARLSDLLVLAMFDAEGLETWRRHPAFLPVLSVTGVAEKLHRYCFGDI